ncbi:hypothetical protein CJF32_00010428 [Rutstroemia sp. NJR-2017a WRK4]|nr:hypothetical protein CJF32_00010428 [Rutstroemia sp. NJR-2017a WRK4]
MASEDSASDYSDWESDKPPKTSLELLMAGNMRVVRNYITLEELIAVYPSLKEKALSNPSTLTDEERRTYLDLPNVETETTNLRAVTALSREELIEKAIKDSSSLTEEEVDLLQHHFWTPKTAADLGASGLWGYEAEWEETLMGEEGEEFYEALTPAYLPNEKEAFSAGSSESSGRYLHGRRLKASALAEAALPNAPEWIRRLYRERKKMWGFVVFIDGAMQELRARALDDFVCSLEGQIKFALSHNGSKNIIQNEWRMVAGAGTALDASDSSSQEEGVVLRKAFRDILQDPFQYEQRADVVPISYSRETRTADFFKDVLVTPDILTNTFLVFDRICKASVLETGHYIESMRIRAFEANYPVPGKEYPEGYKGYTWVRLDQLVTNFYELRSMKADEVGMDEIWQSAQQSRNAAFVSMDSKEAGNCTPSNPMGGFLPDSVLGKRKYAMQ